MSVYTALPQSTNRSWNSLAIVKGKLYGSVETGGSAYIYEIDKVTGEETLKKTATGLNYRGIGNYKDTLAVVDIGGNCLAYDTADFTTVKYSWPSASGMAWTCVFGFLDNAYALKYNANSNQLGIFGSDGSVTFKTTSTSTRYFSGVTLARNWIYGASQTGYIYKINTNTGEETQLTAAGTAAWRGLTSDTNYLYAAVASGRIYRVNPTTGASVELTGDTANRNWISLVWENGVIYGADNAGKIYSITLDTTVTAEYSYPSATGRQYMGLAEVGGTLYTAINGLGVYSVNKSTGAVTQIYSEVKDWRVMAKVGSNLLCSQYGGSLKLISTSGTLVKNFGTDYWFGACDDPSDSNVAYSCCYSKASNQIAKLNISAGTVQYYTTANRTYVGIVCLGNYLYACVNGGLIYKIDKTTFAETVFCNESRGWIDMKTDGTYLYSVVNPGQVRRIDVSTGVSEIILGDPAGDNTNRPWQCLEYSSSDKAVWSGIFAYELWKLALQVPAVPTSSVSTSTIYSDTAVTLSCSTSGVTIKYTTDGSTPSATNGTPYSAPFTVSKTTTIKFCAIKDGYLTAGVDVVLTYQLSPAVSSLAAGTYYSMQTITLTSESPSVNIYYTKDGTNPSAASTLYTGPFTIDISYTLKTIAIRSGYASSDISTYQYEYDKNVGNYYLLPETSSIIYYGLAFDAVNGLLFASASGTDSTIDTIDTNTGAATYWGFNDPKMKLYYYSNKLYTASYGIWLSSYAILTGGGRGTETNWYITNSNWTALSIKNSTLYAFKDGYLYSGFTSAGNTQTKITTVYKNVTCLTTLSNTLYACVGGDGIYTINTSTGAYTKLASSTSRSWTSICNDGTNLYGCVNGGYVYKIDPSTGADTQILGDTTTRAWNNVVYYNGVLYASVSTGGGIYKITMYNAVTNRYAYDGSAWKNINGKWVYNGSTWKPINAMWKYIGGTWTKVF